MKLFFARLRPRTVRPSNDLSLFSRTIDDTPSIPLAPRPVYPRWYFRKRFWSAPRKVIQVAPTAVDSRGASSDVVGGLYADVGKNGDAVITAGKAYGVSGSLFDDIFNVSGRDGISRGNFGASFLPLIKRDSPVKHIPTILPDEFEIRVLFLLLLIKLISAKEQECVTCLMYGPDFLLYSDSDLRAGGCQPVAEEQRRLSAGAHASTRAHRKLTIT